MLWDIARILYLNVSVCVYTCPNNNIYVFIIYENLVSELERGKFSMSYFFYALARYL